MGNIKIHDTDYISDIKQIIEQSRKHTYASINTIMIKSYWLVGRRIVEEEQGGKHTPIRTNPKHRLPNRQRHPSKHYERRFEHRRNERKRLSRITPKQKQRERRDAHKSLSRRHRVTLVHHRKQHTNTQHKL